MSMPMPGGADEPETTGSIAAPVQVEKPVPETLAYSDATKIGQAAAAVVWQAGAGGNAEWINAATGSSGTVEQHGAADADADACQAFTTLVTSIGGVHIYKGKVCRRAGEPSLVQIDP